MSHSSGYSNLNQRSVWRQDMSQQSVFKRALVVICTVLALFFGIVLMFLFLESSEKSAAALIRQNLGDLSERVDHSISLVSTARVRDSLRYYTALPHVAGSRRDRETAEWTAAQWRAAGISQVDIEELRVLLSYANRTSVRIREQGGEWSAVRLAEPVRDELMGTQPITWNSWAKSGRVVGQVVFANYGRAVDFDAATCALTQGRVALVKYGRSFRGNKVANAERCGAIGVLIYSDPADDGAGIGRVYPDGAWRNPDSVQRGSLWMFGDPETPGFASTADGAPRIWPRSKLRERDPEHPARWPLPNVPVMPLSANAAKSIFARLGGPAAPSEWSGVEGVTYRMGGTDAVQIEIDIEMDERLTSIYNVIGRIDGADDDSPVILGNHRDAWTYGAADPGSGSAVLNEVAHVLGNMHEGWRPMRTILLCSWDAEEMGLIGSSEFVERRRVELGRSAVAYFNVDVAVSGHTRVSVNTVPSLNTVLREVAARVPYIKPSGTGPRTSGSELSEAERRENSELARSWFDFEDLLHFWNATQQLDKDNPPPADAYRLPTSGAIGSGSDFLAFLQLIGVASSDMGFSFDHSYGTYHSNDDNYRWMAEYADPGFSRHTMLAQWWVGLAVRMADQLILPFDFEEYASETQRYLRLVQQYAADTLPDTLQLDWRALQRAADAFNSAAKDISVLQAEARELSMPAVRALNRRMVSAERAFLDRRERFETMRHVLFRPATDNAYASAPLSTIYSAINGYVRGEKTQYQVQFELLAVAAAIDEVAALLKPSLLTQRDEKSFNTSLIKEEM